MIDAPLNDRVANDADAVSVGDHHRAFEKSGFFDPGRAGHFAVAIVSEPAGENRIAHGFCAARKDRGDAGAHRAFADLQFAFAGDERGVADGYAGYVGDGVERAGRAVKRDAEIAGAWLGVNSSLERFPARRRQPRKMKSQRETR